MKKPIKSSSLALRFYVKDGWTKEELDSCCIQGEVKLSFIDDSIEYQYYILDHLQNSRFDVDKLMEKMSVLVRAFDDRPNETDGEFIKKFNW